MTRGHFNPPSGRKIRGETLIFGSCPHSQSPVLSCFGVNVTIVASSFVNSPHELPLLALVDVSRGCWWSAGPYPYYGVGHPGHLGSPWGELVEFPLRSKHLFQRRLGLTRWPAMGAAQRKRSVVQADQRSSCRVQLTGICLPTLRDGSRLGAAVGVV